MRDFYWDFDTKDYKSLNEMLLKDEERIIKASREESLATLITSYQQQSFHFLHRANSRLSLVVPGMIIGTAVFVLISFLTMPNERKINVAEETLLKISDSLENRLTADTLNKIKTDSTAVLNHITLNTLLSKVKTNLTLIHRIQDSHGRLTIIFSNSIVRIGFLVIIGIFFQILFKLYRYDLRLSNYFSARAFALEIHMKDSNNSLEMLIKVLSPDQYDIGTSKSFSEPLNNLINKMGNGK